MLGTGSRPPPASSKPLTVSYSPRCGLSDVKKQVGEGIRARYDLKLVGERTVEQAVTEHPAFANARGMLKYLRFVCEVPV